MADNTFKIKVITPEDTYFEGDCLHLMAPGVKGYLGVLINHAPLVSPLEAGNVEIRLPDKKEKKFSIEKGFLEVSNNQALLLAEKIDEELIKH